MLRYFFILNKTINFIDRTTQKDIVFKDKPKQETAAERKLKAHIAKINSFSIKIKPVRNDNTL